MFLPMLTLRFKRTLPIMLMATAAITLSCGRFSNAPAQPGAERYVVISPIYNEIIWALGAHDKVVGVDLSSTYPPEIKNTQTVGYHRALSAEGILSLHPTAVIHDGNIGPPQVVEQIQSLNIPMKTFAAKNDSVDGAKALIKEIGDFVGQPDRAQELCSKLDSQLSEALELVKKYSGRPKVAVIH